MHNLLYDLPSLEMPSVITAPYDSLDIFLKLFLWLWLYWLWPGVVWSNSFPMLAPIRLRMLYATKGLNNRSSVGVSRIFTSLAKIGKLSYVFPVSIWPICVTEIPICSANCSCDSPIFSNPWPNLITSIKITEWVYLYSNCIGRYDI